MPDASLSSCIISQPSKICVSQMTNTTSSISSSSGSNSTLLENGTAGSEIASASLSPTNESSDDGNLSYTVDGSSPNSSNEPTENVYYLDKLTTNFFEKVNMYLLDV